ncbi:P-selectin isoform X2 [Puntigrus tetrazona]|uniref:P-selectin isoform X2 n=1 Tax=Puntigrus tetrazona TaxID=1606681 RepID=UPI001C89FB73|nr:P-selectin isoform X2 [Puntigrus tetrazona]
MVLSSHIRLFGYLVLITGNYDVKAWTYNYSTNVNMDWTTARQWCQERFTDMVAIQNHKEVEYLNQFLPFHPTYYWIGIRKIDGNWTWVGTKKILDPGAENWAENEPNNKGSGQDCVEIYIKRSKETAKWNDEKCSKKKATVCYLASCSKESCSEHAECVENIGSYECQCHPGFKGPRCEEAVQCLAIIDAPGGGNMNCTHPFSINSFNSSCEFRCEEGFELKGSNTTWCDQTGNWTHKPPTCQAVACDPLMTPANSQLTCADPLGKFSFRSSCNTACEEGYTLRGETTLTCQSDGNWSAPSPACEVIRCDALESVQHGSLRCRDHLGKFSYGSLCWLECAVGFTLNGTNSTYCTLQGKWSQEFPVCQALQCRPLMNPSRGTVNCSHPNGQFSFGTVCEVSCEAGFKLHGTPQTECLDMGKWTDATPFCFAQQCPRLTAPVNGWLNCSHPHSLFSFGSQCFSGCEPGFEITGESNMECSASGNWSQEMPSCAAVRCKPLLLFHLPELGPPPSMNCSHPHGNFSFGSECMFQCAESQELSGTSQLFCSSSGSWTNSPPRCVVKKMSLSTGMLMYTAVGAASSAGLLLLGGLIFLLMRQFSKKAKYSRADSLWKENLNPIFEFN